MFKDSLLDLNQEANLHSSELIVDTSVSILLQEYNKLVSSANNIKCRTLEQFIMSLIYIMNKRGPSIEP